MSSSHDAKAFFEKVAAEPSDVDIYTAAEDLCDSIRKFHLQINSIINFEMKNLSSVAQGMVFKNKKSAENFVDAYGQLFGNCNVYRSAKSSILIQKNIINLDTKIVEKFDAMQISLDTLAAECQSSLAYAWFIFSDKQAVIKDMVDQMKMYRDLFACHLPTVLQDAKTSLPKKIIPNNANQNVLLAAKNFMVNVYERAQEVKARDEMKQLIASITKLCEFLEPSVAPVTAVATTVVKEKSFLSRFSISFSTPPDPKKTMDALIKNFGIACTHYKNAAKSVGYAFKVALEKECQLFQKFLMLNRLSIAFEQNDSTAYSKGIVDSITVICGGFSEEVENLPASSTVYAAKSNQ